VLTSSITTDEAAMLVIAAESANFAKFW